MPNDRLAPPRKNQSRPPAPGDLMVTKVGDRYHIGQVKRNGHALTPITMRTDCQDAVAFACRFAMRRQRVFLCPQATSRNVVEIRTGKTH